MRKFNFELLRIMSIIFIVLFHCANVIGLPEEVSVNRFVLVCFGSWGILGVNIFFVLSIYFMKDKKFSSFKVMRLLLEVLFYSTILIIAGIIYRNKMNGESYISVLKQIFKDGVYQPFFSNMYWFVSAYLFLYVSTPLLKKVWSVSNKKVLVTMCSVLYFYAMLLQNINLFSDFIYIMIIYFISMYLFEQQKNWFERNCFKGMFFCTSLIIGIRSVLPNIECRAVKWGGVILANVSRYSPIMFINAIFVFYFFAKIEIPYKKVINILAKTSFGIYLFHDNIFFSLRYIILDNLRMFYDFSSLRLSELLSIYFGTTIIILAGGFILDLFRIMLEKKVIDKWYKKEKYDFIDTRWNI